MIEPYELLVRFGEAEPICIKIDPESTIDDLFFILDQSGQSECHVTLDGLRDLVKAAEILEKTTRKWKSEGDHYSDCATNSEPAYPKGKCDCAAQDLGEFLHRYINGEVDETGAQTAAKN